MNHKFKVDEQKCTKCGLCVKNCPTKALTQNENNLPEMELAKNCMLCQHCLAICPNEAISILDKNPQDSALIKEINPDDILNLIQTRRSIRKYKQENVDSATIQKLKDMLNYSPTGKNHHSLHFSFIEDIEVMNEFRSKVYTAIINFLDKKPIKFLSEKFKKFDKMKNEILKGNDIIFRDAPHLVVACTPINSPCPHQDGVIALSYFELYANSLGLGTCWCGYAHAAIKMFPEFAEYLHIPSGYTPIYAMLFGYKDIEYKRAIQPKEYSFTTVGKQDLEVDFFTKIKRFFWNIIR